jgi:FG-GAP-like repeat/ASPIC and UnbV/Bacterial TSP3 repeat
MNSLSLTPILVGLLLATPVFAAITFTKIATGLVSSGASGTAAAWGDYNNDGWIDLYVTTLNGSSYLYRNNGDGTFTSITGVPITAGGVNSFGCAWADYDNDGFLDLIQGGYNLSSRLFRNQGDGTFSRIATGLMANIARGANNALWADYDNDGWVDLFIAISYNSPKNVLYHNEGNGSFSQVTNSPLVNTPGNAQGAAWGDYDNDGRLDLVINHTGGRSQLFHNDSAGRFTEITNSPITELSSEVYAGACWGDYDNDGLLDLFVTSYGHHSALYHNNGNGIFVRMTNNAVARATAKSTGGAWADYDNDGFLDLFVANDGSTKSFLYHNNGDGTFTAVTNGPIVQDLGTAQGAAWGDYNNDGFPDLFVPNVRSVNNALYRNNGNSNNWLGIRLTGRRSNRAALGAKVRVGATIGGIARWQMRETSGGGSLGSQDDLRARFGLGDATQADLVRIEWPSGIVQEFHDVPARHFLAVTESMPDTDGDGLPDEWELAHGLNPTDASDAGLDADGDGLSNAQEYAAGTDPQDARSSLRIETAAVDGNHSWRVNFVAISNRTYTLQAREGLGNSYSVRYVADVPAAPTNRLVELMGPLDASTRQQFFQIVTPRQP